MAASQQNINSSTPMGANLIANGATFRVWAPKALEVYLVPGLGTVATALPPGADYLLLKDANGHWTGFFPNLARGQLYMYYVIGTAGSSLKRDPYARALTMDNNALNWQCILEDAAFPWHDDSFITPAFGNMVIYQLHVGSFYIQGPQVSATFLDVVAKIPHLAALGITVLQLLPIHEFNTSTSQGYNGCDLYSPEQLYTVAAANLPPYLTAVNQLLSAKALSPYQLSDINGGPAQLRALVDVCHCYGIAVIFDMVYHHCGPDFDDHDLSFLDMSAQEPDYDQSAYLTNRDYIGKVMNFSRPEVCDFLIRNAVDFVTEYHADGFRFDEISLLNANGQQPYAWQFCQNLTSTLKYVKPNLLLHAEYWDGEYWVSKTQLVVPAPAGLGFDTTLSDGQRNGIRNVIGAASQANDDPLDMYGLGAGLWQGGFPQQWQLVQGPENQDVTLLGHDGASRIASLSDPSDSRSWYATSRSRVAMGICLTAPGIPMMFMGQEFLEDQLWSDNFNLTQNLLNWNGLQTQKQMADFLLFTTALISLRWQYPALRGQGFACTHNNNAARVLAYHRWIPGEGRDIMVVVHLGNTNAYNYRVGFPIGGTWKEAFNSDYFENCPNPDTCGNGGWVSTDSQVYDGFAFSAALTLPANGVLVFKV